MTRGHQHRMVVGAAAWMFVIAAFATPAAGQTEGNAPSVPAAFTDEKNLQPQWGPSATSTLSVPAWAFQPLNGATLTSVGHARFNPDGTEVLAPFHLPSGVIITELQVVGCDSSATEAVAFTLYAIAANGSSIGLSAAATTGDAATPGCGVFTHVLTNPHLVDNVNNTYVVALAAGITSATRFTAVRVRYKLQVSAAPGTATFVDVPVGHPLHRFVEALVASGITGGCGSGNYCPDAPLTRGQMAVFLSAALGLQFPN